MQFVNPGSLGPLSTFRSQYVNPILKSRDPKASATAKELGQKRTAEVMALVFRFFLRRTAAAVLRHLIPPKSDLVLFVRPTPAQRRLYETVAKVGLTPALLGEDVSSIGLKLIDALRKVRMIPISPPSHSLSTLPPTYTYTGVQPPQTLLL